jgi:hypothetical protein
VAEKGKESKMSRVAMFEGIRRRRKGRKGRKGRKSRKRSSSLGLHTPKPPKGYHWRMRKTRKDAGKKGGKTLAQKIFARAAHSCPYPKNGTAKQRRSSYNNCIREAIKRLQRASGAKPGQGTYRKKR